MDGRNRFNRPRSDFRSQENCRDAEGRYFFQTPTYRCPTPNFYRPSPAENVRPLRPSQVYNVQPTQFMRNTLPLHTLLELGQTLSNRLPVPLTVSKSVALPSLRLKFPFSTRIRAVVNVVVSTSHTVYPLVQTVSQTVQRMSP